MKRHLSIKTVVILAFVFLTGLLILGYSLLSARFFNQGVSRVITDNMEITVEIYHRSIPKDSRKPIYYFGNYRITTDWKYMPDTVKASFPTIIPPSKKLYIANNAGLLNKLGSNYYIMAVQKEDITYYVCQWIGFSTPPGIFGWNSMENIRSLIVLSCVIGIGIAIVLWLIAKHITRPMFALSLWTKNLDKEKIENDIPDFHYQELNELASLLREKFTAEQENMKREQEFLHNASHELRTPITIISQNIEVLNKVHSIDTKQARMMENKAVKRLGRAANNISALMETLLWIGSKKTIDLPRKEIQLDRFLNEMIESLAFLLKGKHIKLDIQTSPAVINVPEAPLRIILANLIRNAFHHTSGGTVIIHQTAGVISIINDDIENNNKDNLGFGFGLSLTAKLIDKMDWSYQNEARPGGHKVIIRLDQ